MRKNFFALFSSAILILFISSCGKKEDVKVNKIDDELKKIYADGTKMAKDITVKVTAAKASKEVLVQMKELSNTIKSTKDSEAAAIKKFNLPKADVDKAIEGLKADIDGYKKALTEAKGSIDKASGKFLLDFGFMAEYGKWKLGVKF